MDALTYRMLARRAFLGRSSQGVGAAALAALALPAATAPAAPLRGVLGPLPLPQKATRVIWLTMAGGPSHLETFDPKPKLAALDGQPMPESLTKGQQLAQLQAALPSTVRQSETSFRTTLDADHPAPELVRSVLERAGALGLAVADLRIEDPSVEELIARFYEAERPT